MSDTDGHGFRERKLCAARDRRSHANQGGELWTRTHVRVRPIRRDKGFFRNATHACNEEESQCPEKWRSRYWSRSASPIASLSMQIKDLIVYSVTAAIVAAILVAPSAATDGELRYQCNNVFGGASNNTYHWGGFAFSAYAQWDEIGPSAEHPLQNNLAFKAWRQDSGYNPTFEEWSPGWAAAGRDSYRWTWTPGRIDMYRRTGVQRAGYAFDKIGADDWSGHGC